MKRKYNPNKYDDYLASLMEHAYEAIEKGDNTLLEIYCSTMHDELKTQFKSGIITETEWHEIEKYFWSFYK